MSKHVEGRATLDLQKKEVMSRILNAWLANPQLRLGQLLINAIGTSDIKEDIFNVEDYVLMEAVKAFDEKQNPVIHPQITIQVIKGKQNG